MPKQKNNGPVQATTSTSKPAAGFYDLLFSKSGGDPRTMNADQVRKEIERLSQRHVDPMLVFLQIVQDEGPERLFDGGEIAGAIEDLEPESIAARSPVQLVAGTFLAVQLYALLARARELGGEIAQFAENDIQSTREIAASVESAASGTVAAAKAA